MEFPMPNTQLDGRTVVASIYSGEEDSDVLVILLAKKPPFYRVAEYSLVTGKRLWSEKHPNINPAVNSYRYNGGDY